MSIGSFLPEAFIHANEIHPFATLAFAMMLTPGPNMIYMISRTIAQARVAGLISLAGGGAARAVAGRSARRRQLGRGALISLAPDAVQHEP